MNKFKNFKSASAWCVFLFAYLMAHPAFAATFYIDSVTGDDSRSYIQAQNQSTPWAHVPGMDGAAGNCYAYSPQSGDIFILKGGSVWKFASTTNDLLVVRSAGTTIMGGQRLATPWGAGYPILDGSTSSATRSGIYIRDKSNITIDGLKIVNLVNYADGSGNGIAIAGAAGNIEIKNCYIDNTGVNALAYGPSGSVSHFLFHGNTVTNCGRVHVGVNDGVKVDDVQLFNNTMLGPGYWPAHNYHGDGFMIGANCTTNPSTLTNVSIHHNKFYGNWSSGATALIYLNDHSGPAGQYNRWGGYHAKIYNNLLAIETDGLISPAFITIADGWKDVKIYNNTMNAKTTLKPVSRCIALAYLPADAGIDIRNNIISGCQNGITAGNLNASTGLTVQNNLYRTDDGTKLIWDKDNRWNTITELQARGYEKNANAASLVNVDPKFIKLPDGTTGSGNWNLQADSPARSGGIDLGAPYNVDINGITGTNRIGTYEYVPAGTVLPGLTSGSTSPNTCIQMPTLTRTIACPAGKTGSITQQQVSTCPGPVYSEWTTTSNTCVNAKRIVKRIFNR